ncbi:hypothetical protein RF679_14260 [Undibacterium cyanobacteriorum]|uniref:Uncharacterized protein n=1 Tax=Undibacterium cyanobacteriorum TaxID=3073561 RepID=A0ABY9RF07_9BURK|nr:hypothetical protein [Undibacterium sp. 20NA77.5]WMW79802.1 hypothetical protein RF679_14260 [Undibacterium sp. 20NA77.5]
MKHEPITAVRFIGYAISTFPAHLRDGLGGGTYLGNASVERDLEMRVCILKNAIDTAKAQLPADEVGATVNNIFLVPEFFFHGAQGPYLYADGEEDPILRLQRILVRTFPAKDYSNWTFVLGTAITARVSDPKRLFESNSVQVRNETVKFLVSQERKARSALSEIVTNTLKSFIQDCQGIPDVAVRGRTPVFSHIPLVVLPNGIESNWMTTEKYFMSGEDFVLYSTSGHKDVITEQMVAYPHIDLSAGDVKLHSEDSRAIFGQKIDHDESSNFIRIGVEICLDHEDARLRSNLDIESNPEMGSCVHIHLVPSCGMAIRPGSVVADADGFVFNCDGQYPLDATNASVECGAIDGVPSIYINHNPSPIDAYNFHCAHTQFARVKVAAKGNNPNLNSAEFQELDSTDVLCVAVLEPQLEHGVLSDYFAGGPGAVHIYGVKQGFSLKSNLDEV